MDKNGLPCWSFAIQFGDYGNTTGVGNVERQSETLFNGTLRNLLKREKTFYQIVTDDYQAPVPIFVSAACNEILTA